MIVSALAGCTVAALAAPAFGEASGVTLHRDGSKAVPFVADVATDAAGSSNGPVLRRDGSKAVPFVADSEPTVPATADGFDWGDAGIGAAFALATLGLAGVLVAGKRRNRSGSPAPGVGRASAS
jgi:hypothetical protein